MTTIIVVGLLAILAYALYEVWRLDRVAHNFAKAAHLFRGRLEASEKRSEDLKADWATELSLLKAEADMLRNSDEFKAELLKIASKEIEQWNSRYRLRGDEVDKLAIENEYLREALGEILWEMADEDGDPEDAARALEKGMRAMAGDAP